MRFFADGPTLPDELLAARDEGRVLFFCGAGVSRAKANLPGFVGLARAVMRELRVLPESPAYKLVEAVERQAEIAGVGGLLATDRVFGLLEREFPVRAIEAAVGTVLRPDVAANLSAHRILLDLSTNATGKTRLVTTNFELLFERAKPKLPVFTPNNLPDLRTDDGFEGIVHLHGMFDPSYAKATGGNLVLSSGEFGRAYLSEGWATQFIRAVFEKYMIVFVGYAADDPPVQYLLEALYRVAGAIPDGRYAFQAGREDEAHALWSQKGVAAIPYTAEGKDHAALWATLDAWAKRARDPEGWRKNQIRNARRGPATLAPHERGQIVHLAVTEDGARAIAQSNPPLPATWLCVFDPAVRYAPPGKLDPMKVDEPDIDPFTHFAIDSDTRPPPPNPNQLFQRREAPPDAVDVFAPQQLDQRETAGQFRGHRDRHISDLSPRLSFLGTWFRRVSNQPAAVWWAAGQAGLHPAVITDLRFALDHRDLPFQPVMRSAWRYVFEGWNRTAGNDHQAFALNAAFQKDGWTKPLIRRFADIRRCWLKSSRPYWGGVLPPTGRRRPLLRDLVSIEIEYPERHVPFAIPDDQLAAVVPLMRRNLEYAVDLDHELSPAVRLRIAPIIPDPNLPGKSAERDYGINAWVMEYVAHFERLRQHDKSVARGEWAAWRRGNDPVFGRLRVWATGLAEFLCADEAGRELIDSDDVLFWGSRDQRDVLLALKTRWATLAPDLRIVLEKRILKGPPRAKHASAAQNRAWHAVEVLDRIGWLNNEGCAFATRTDKLIARLVKVAPQWRQEQAAHAADSNEARGGTVVMDKSFAAFADVSIAELIPKVLGAQQRVWGALKENDPFAGLAEQRPVRVLAALAYELRQGRDVVQAWTRLLYSSARRTDKPKLSLLIALRLATLPQRVLDTIVQPAAYWLEAVNANLHMCHANTLYRLFDRLVESIQQNPGAAEHERRDAGSHRDWVNVAYGSAAGHLCDVLFADRSIVQLQHNMILPPSWVARADSLLNLPNDHANYSLVHFARRLGWLHVHAQIWSEEKILQPLLGEDERHDAALAGFYTNAQVNDERLYQLLKSKLIDLATNRGLAPRRDTMALGGLFVGGWLAKTEEGVRWLTDDEFRRILIYADDELRGHVLWYVEKFQIADKLIFLHQVWPLQFSVRTPIVVGRLCTLAFGDAAHFTESRRRYIATRLNRHSAHPYHCAGEVDEGEEVDGAPVVAGGDTPEVLEFVEAPLDAVSQAIDISVVVIGLCSSGMRRDDGGCADCGNRLAQRSGVVSTVAKNITGALAGQQYSSFCDVMCLSRRQRKAQWPAQTVGQHVYLGGQSASGAPQSLILVPPFPVAAC